MSLNLYVLKGIAFQNPNLWEFYLTDGRSPIDFKFLVSDISLPLKKLETVTRNTGSKHYTGFTPEEDVTLTFRETNSFAMYEYFKEWMDDIYDPMRKVFKTGPGKTKTGVLAFQKPISILGVPTVNTYNKTFQMNGMKIKGIEAPTLNYNTQDALTMTATFTVEEITEPTTNLFTQIAALENTLASVIT